MLVLDKKTTKTFCTYKESIAETRLRNIINGGNICRRLNEGHVVTLQEQY